MLVSWCFGFQTWFIGQGLNDNQWHQVSITRRGGSIRLTIDDEPPIQGCQFSLNELFRVEVY